jgi:hypothetical protein
MPPRVISPFGIEVKIFIKPIGLIKEPDNKGETVEKSLFPSSSV